MRVYRTTRPDARLPPRINYFLLLLQKQHQPKLQSGFHAASAGVCTQVQRLLNRVPINNIISKVWATAATQWTARVWYRHNQRWLQASKEGAEAQRQRAGVSKMKGSGARNALRIWIRGEWGDRRRIRGVRTSSSQKDSAEERLENG